MMKKLKDVCEWLGVVGFVLAWIMAMIAAFAFAGDTQTGYYAPDYVDANGALVDIDGDGDCYHWVEE